MLVVIVTVVRLTLSLRLFLSRNLSLINAAFGLNVGIMRIIVQIQSETV